MIKWKKMNTGIPSAKYMDLNDLALGEINEYMKHISKKSTNMRINPTQELRKYKVKTLIIDQSYAYKRSMPRVAVSMGERGELGLGTQRSISVLRIGLG